MAGVQMKQHSMQEWKTIFPDFTTLAGSCQFIKKLIAVSLSTITYVRGIFPTRAYGERKLFGLKLKLLTEDSGIKGVDKFINLIRSCYDAVEKKYLSQLSIGICLDEDNPEEVVEAYNLTFRYTEDGCSLLKSESVFSPMTESDPIMKATIIILKNIISIDNILGPLPEKAYLTMKLLYNEEITPPDYEPPGFEASLSEKFIFNDKAVKISLGKVITESHGYKMYLKTSLGAGPLSDAMKESILNDSQGSNEVISAEETVIPANSYINSPISQNSKIMNKSPKLSAGKEERCPCGCKDDSTEIINCKTCDRKLHAVCYGILTPETYEGEMHCTQCIRDEILGSPEIDMIHELEGEEQRKWCAMRRALVYCSTIKNVTLCQLEKSLGCNKILAKKLMECLETEGFIQKTKNKLRFKILEEQINDGFKDYFSRYQADNRKQKENMDQVLNRSNENCYSKKKVQNQWSSGSLHHEVQKMGLNDLPSDNSANRRSKRRSLQVMNNEDSGELFETHVGKKRCLSTREIIPVNKQD